MLFVEPLWLSVLIPILLAPIPVGASLVIRQRRAPTLGAACVAAAGLAIAVVLGGAVFAVCLILFTLFTHRAALWIAAAVSAARSGTSSWPRVRVIVALVVIAQIASVIAMMRTGLKGGLDSRTHGRLLPFGPSFFAFHGISYLIAVYRGRLAPERSRTRLSVYLMLLPQFVSGPVAFDAAAPQLARRLPSVSDYSFGVRRLVIGVWKVFVMAALAAAQTDAVFALRPERLSPLQAWVGVASLSLQIYYAFSGYADMAVGLGRMFGIRLPENFRWPMVAESVREFWERWHIGLSAWFRECAAVADDRRVLPPTIGVEPFVALLCGVWYGIGPTFVVWGGYHAMLIAVEQAGLGAVLTRLPAILRHAYLVIAVALGWLLLRCATLQDAWIFVHALVGASAPTAPSRLTFGYDVWLLLAAGAIGCAPLSPMVRRWTVAIDAVIVSGLMAVLASVLFTWRGVRIMIDPAVRLLARLARNGGVPLKRARL